MTGKQIKEINEQIKKAIQRIENIWEKYDKLREKYKTKEQECIEKTNAIVALDGQLQTKEQECERLKQGYAKLTEIVSLYMDDFTGYNEEFGGFDVVLCVEQLLEQFDQFKTDREEALKQLEFVRTLNTIKEAENIKLSQTLEEIKGVIKQGVKIHDDIIISKQILQKFSEVK